ncbi:MAG: T9SS type A sorting domain-containing protein [Bacteroidetes bacterium]|nr:T9SS type A sorting domain-containing protein [Bacteroidota bacterium]
MRSTLLAIGLAFAIAPSFAQQASNNYNRSVFYNSQLIGGGQSRENQQKLGRLQQLMPGMNARFDRINGSLSDVFGVALNVSGNSPEAKAQFILAQQLSNFGFNLANWQFVVSTPIPNGNYVSYTSKIDGREVVFSSLNFRFTSDGKLERIIARNYGEPDKTISPTLSSDAALQLALNDTKGVIVTNSSIQADWAWFPIPTSNGYKLKPAYAFNIKGVGESLPVDLNGYIDAISGQILYRTNAVKENVTQTINGNVFKHNPLLPSSNEPLANLKVTVGANTYYTDTAGLLNISTLNTPITATVRLEGKWSKVIASASAGVTPNFQDTITTNGQTYLFRVDTPSTARHVNAYYHVNRVHDFMKKFYPSFTGMDIVLPTNVDVTGNCNAFYNGSSINFYKAGNGCNSFAYCGDIIYHEYGHGISDKFYASMGKGTINNGALNEANSDIWGISITQDPVLGKGSMANGGIIRRYDLAPKVYPVDIQGEVHADGEIVAGAWWDVAVNLNSVDSMTRLFTQTYYDTPDGPNGTEGSVYHQVLISALKADDNDNNLNNGTPHFMQIVKAFARHGIYLLGDATLVHKEIPNPPANTPISISANLTLSTPGFFNALYLYYTTRNGIWDTLSMVAQGGGTYTAQIPAQPEGTMVDYYFGVSDISNFLSATFPMSYIPGAASQNTIPYQFGVGINQQLAIDFENPLSNWTIGNVTNDNATNGLWVQAKPIGSFVNGILTGTQVQPNFDHSTGTTGKCLVTANALSTSSSISSADVDGGRTSVISQVFDFTGFTDPVIEYWRWYTNNAGSNPNQDYWTVFIKDSTSPVWVVRVDYTKTTDNSWRRRIFRVNEYMNIANTSRKLILKFQAEDAAPESIVEAAVDDIFIYDKAWSTALNDPQSNKAIIFPNPAEKMLTVRLAKVETGHISLYDLTGKEMLRVALDGKTDYNISVDHLPAGNYFLSIKTAHFIQSQKVSVAH